MGFAINRRIVVGMLETVSGTPEFNLTSTFPDDEDFNNRFTNIEFSPNVEIDEEVGNVATGDDAELESLSMSRSGDISMVMPCTWGGAVATEPLWIPYIKACGIEAHDYTTVGIGFQPLSEYNMRTMTIAVIDIDSGTTPSAKGYLFKGCAGDYELGASAVGGAWKFKLKFKGAYVGEYTIANDNIPVLTDPPVATPEKLLSNVVSVHGTTLMINSFNLVGGNEIKMIPNQADTTGIKQFYISARKPRLQMNTIMNPIATEDVFTKVTTEATGVASITGLHMKLDLPRVQYLTTAQAEIEGLVGYNQNFKLLRNSNGVSSGIADLPDQATFELLQGARA